MDSTTIERTTPLPDGQPKTAPTAGRAASRPGMRLRVLGIGGLVVVALAGALAAGTIPRQHQQQRVDQAAAAAAAAAPGVTVALARARSDTAERVLPGNSLPLLEAALFPRATGYIQTRLVDIGDHVQKGQLLAVIAAPDLDDQLQQARANLEQARANLKLNEANAVFAKITLDRSVNIERIGSGAVAQQEIDQERATLATSRASVDTAKASIQTNEATVQQLADLQAFEKTTAPFAGVITARNIETGDLVTANSTARELFHLMRTDTLRVFVNVPQVFATGIHVGQAATVYRREDTEHQYPGKVTRTANALDPNTRTLLTEVDVANPKEALRPGMYLQVKFLFDREASRVLIPAAALATRTGGPRVAVLDNQNRVQYRTVQLGRDYGAEIEVTAGLGAGETVVVHPGDDLAVGTVVRPVPLQQETPGTAAAG